MSRSESKPNPDQREVSALKPLTSSRSRFAGGEALPRQAFASPGTIAGRGSEFVEFVEPQRDAKELVLSPDISRTLYDVVDEYRHGDTIRSHGLPLRSRLLFCGPPGCGKSLTAEVLAREVGLPFMIAKLDTLVGSMLGETASNLRRMFETAERQTSVLFLDEFDALARTRSDPTEHSEMRRVVNNLLLMIEQFKGRGVVVAATNLESTIDPAIIRRFDEVILFDRPNATEIRRLIKFKTRNFGLDFDIAEDAKQLLGRSHADVERICFTAMRHAIMARRKKIFRDDFDYAIKSDRRRKDIQNKVSTSI
ncbi:AAA family ATPase [Mesorhizobium sp. Root172]|jgi:SpoVK/Ycf46/Vps4 family AAA+-type ATPase|uniref:AAA family ATPase n=1 Tax=Mesorhizobium sp. Root172 TaxID=1736481 RepID=UPI0006FB0BD4|nr:ATP-binding protein [Mesorhizobium sp. Root172]KRB29899.1 AAA family ATPase [Mesorhizobium sp. Root172]